MIPWIITCALFMQLFDAAVIAMALPSMAESFQTTTVRMNVAISSYLLACAVFVPISGWLADRFGAKTIFLFAISGFTVTSLACALATHIDTLILFRFLQGICGAMLVPVGRIILLKSIDAKELLKATSFLSIPAMLGPMLGPPLGGLIISIASWHWIFLMNIPIGIIGFILSYRYVQNYRSDQKMQLDKVGFLLTTITMACFVLGLESLGQHERWSWYLIIIGLATGLCYFFYAQKHPHSILDLALLKIPTFSLTTYGASFCRFSVSALPFLLALQLQVFFGYSPFKAGIVTLIGGLGALLIKFIINPLMNAFNFRLILSLSAVVLGISLASMSLLDQHSNFYLITAIVFMIGTFRSLELTGVNALCYADIPKHQMSQASSFAATTQQISFSLGIGIATVSLDLSTYFNQHPEATLVDVNYTYLVIALFALLSAIFYLKLPKNSGNNLLER
ncbi:hypothetical protein IX83_00320 [Basilea psittacipulmonis DSM 24701]|uniref:Major facilitator superfamily (MFS) profile domain-containing protein n=1 Tax=Basilea psittacipulmonis DSM 24701 TaxID=1072685 RepID=A0A077DEX4_9BURK|nr:hypothetical protein IX83_00320 [Basilea psittacipulmonis DSM 24701]